VQTLQRCVAAGVALLLACATARADVPLFRHLGAAQGLPSERVYALAQDTHGCLWVGTADGLARFDGSRFEVFHHDPARADSLPGNVVQSLHADAAGRLWVGLEGAGLAEVLDHGERVRRWQGPSGEDLDADVWAIASDRDGAVYFGGFATGVVRIDPERRGRQVWGSADGLLSEHVLALAEDGQGGLWIGSHGGLQRLQAGRLQSPADGESAAPPGPVFSLDHRDGVLWVGSRHGALRQRDAGFVSLDGLEPGSVLGLVGEAEGGFWVGRREGLLLLDARGLARPALSAQSLASRRSVMDLLRDHEDGLWVASDGGGLLHLPPRWRRFRSWPVGEGGLASAGVSAAAFDDQGRLWSGGSDGRIERIDTATGAASTVAVLEPGEALPQTRITALLVQAGQLWIGTLRGLVRQPLGEPLPAARVWAAEDADAQAPPVGPIDQLLAGGDGSLWLSSHGGGIEQRDAEGRVLRRFGEAEGLAGLDSEQLRWGPDGALWVAGGDGLQRLEPGAQRFASVAALAGQRVFGFAFGPDGRLWVARRSGLSWLRQQDDRWVLGASLPLLAGVEVGGLAMDGAGRLWASSARGLWRIDPERGTARRFGVRDGLPGQEFSDRPMAQSTDGQRLAVVLPQALVQVDSRLFEGQSQAPRLQLEAVGLRRAGAALSLPAEPGLQLRHDDREVRFAARVASFVEPDAWRFRMRLEPFDPDWVELGSVGQRTFSLLPPGPYRLRVAAADPEGVWYERPALQLEVQPPWWQLPWARAAQAALLGALALAVFALYRRRLRVRAAVALADSERRWALAASEQKSQFLATLAHEIRTPMTGLLGMAELLDRSELSPGQRHQLDAVRRSGELLRRLVDDALDLARIEAGKLELRPRPVELGALCEQAVDALRAQAAAKGLRLSCATPVDQLAWVEADPERLQQILFNLLGNAIKFTACGEVRLSLRAGAGSGWVFEVCDSGPGIAVEQRQRLLRRFEQAEGEDTSRRHGGAGLGLAICAELAQAMGGGIELDDAPGAGACVRVVLPLPPCAPVLPDTPAGGYATQSGLDLLLVEDDPLAAETLCALLTASGHRPRHAGHALAALAELEQGPVQVALLDLDLPGLDGLQLAELLRRRHPELVLLAVSARSAPGTEQAVHEAGFAALLRKPVTAARLDAALRALRPGAG
jgi:signal transduction histidine kinase/CheY-like chemotaxis protein/streptogramin lyase